MAEPLKFGTPRLRDLLNLLQILLGIGVVIGFYNGLRTKFDRIELNQTEIITLNRRLDLLQDQINRIDLNLAVQSEKTRKCCE